MVLRRQLARRDNFIGCFEPDWSVGIYLNPGTGENFIIPKTKLKQKFPGKKISLFNSSTSKANQDNNIIMAWYSSFLDPTDIRGLFLYSLIIYFISFLYERYVTPHLSDFADIEKKTRERLIKERTDRERREKKAQEAAKLLKELEKNKMADIPEEEEDEQDERQEARAGNNTEKKKNKKKNNKKAQQKGDGQKVKAE